MSYDGDVDSLTIDEQFIIKLIRAPRLIPRLESMIFVNGVDNEVKGVIDNLDILKRAHLGICDNIGFERMLSISSRPVKIIGSWFWPGAGAARRSCLC